MKKVLIIIIIGLLLLLIKGINPHLIEGQESDKIKLPSNETPASFLNKLKIAYSNGDGNGVLISVDQGLDGTGEPEIDSSASIIKEGNNNSIYSFGGPTIGYIWDPANNNNNLKVSECSYAADGHTSFRKNKGILDRCAHFTEAQFNGLLLGQTNTNTDAIMCNGNVADKGGATPTPSIRPQCNGENCIQCMLRQGKDENKCPNCLWNEVVIARYREKEPYNTRFGDSKYGDDKQPAALFIGIRYSRNNQGNCKNSFGNTWSDISKYLKKYFDPTTIVILLKYDDHHDEDNKDRKDILFVKASTVDTIDEICGITPSKSPNDEADSCKLMTGIDKYNCLYFTTNISQIEQEMKNN